MKKGKLVISLASIALLASCGAKKSSEDYLRPCTESMAVGVANVIKAVQDAENEAAPSELQSFYNYLPTYTKKFNIKYDLEKFSKIETINKITGEWYTEFDESTVIAHKSCNFDLDQLCYTCDLNIVEEHKNVTQTINMKYYLFFIIDEIQEKDVEPLDQKGKMYELLDVDGVKLCLKSYVNMGIDDFLNVFASNALSGYHDGEGPLANGEFSCRPVYAEDDELYNDYYGSDPLDPIMDENFINNLTNWNLVEKCHDMREDLFNDDDDETYLNEYYGSNDNRSLSFKVDSRIKDSEDYTEGGISTDTKETRYYEFRDAYVSKSEFVIDEKRIGEWEDSGGNYYKTTAEQKITRKKVNTYGTADCSIPSDYLDYIPLYE